jgi:hypothetical protein
MNHTKTSIVLCHGVWADGSYFNKIAVHYGLDTHEADFAQAERALGRVNNPSILVGGVITPAGTDDRGIGLVYVAAVAPDGNETVNGQLQSFPPTEARDSLPPKRLSTATAWSRERLRVWSEPVPVCAPVSPR